MVFSEAFKSNRKKKSQREQFEILSRKAKFLKVKSNKQVRSFVRFLLLFDSKN